MRPTPRLYRRSWLKMASTKKKNNNFMLKEKKNVILQENGKSPERNLFAYIRLMAEVFQIKHRQKEAEAKALRGRVGGRRRDGRRQKAHILASVTLHCLL